MFVYYWAPNKVMTQNPYLFFLLRELFRRLGQACIVMKLDPRGPYNLVHFWQGDEWKTTFQSRYGHFEYLAMPFCFTNMLFPFHYFLNNIFQEARKS